MELPCRYCEKRNPECHGTCKEYIEWREEHEKVMSRVREEARIAYLSRERRPKRRHGKK